MASTWNTEYYDIMNFYYWEPQHLGKRRYPESAYKSQKDVMAHLKKMEATLNHQFNFFFRLLPESMYLEFFRSVVSGLVADNYHYQSEDDLEGMQLNDATQPDILFVGSKSIIGVELKIGAKATFEQVLKYAMLFYFEQKHSGIGKECNLIFFGFGSFSNLFKEKPASVEELKRNLSVDMLPDFTKKGGVSLLGEKQAIVDVATSMTIAFVSYLDVYTLLNEIKCGIDKLSPYHDAPYKLIDGMLNELETRGLHACPKT